MGGEQRLGRSFEGDAEEAIDPPLFRGLVAPHLQPRRDHLVQRRVLERAFVGPDRHVDIAVLVRQLAEERRGQRESRLEVERALQEHPRLVVASPQPRRHAGAVVQARIAGALLQRLGKRARGLVAVAVLERLDRDLLGARGLAGGRDRHAGDDGEGDDDALNDPRAGLGHAACSASAMPGRRCKDPRKTTRSPSWRLRFRYGRANLVRRRGTRRLNAESAEHAETSSKIVLCDLSGLCVPHGLFTGECLILAP